MIYCPFNLYSNTKSFSQLFSKKHKIAFYVRLHSVRYKGSIFGKHEGHRYHQGRGGFGSLVQVTDDRSHCHFMAPSAMLKVEICERISREYISQQTWRSHPTCYEFYGGSNSYSLGMCMCVRREKEGERDEIKVTINLMNGITFSVESVTS